MKNQTKLSVPAYLLPIAAVAAIAALIVAFVSCTGEGLGMDNMTTIILLTVGVVLLLCGATLIVAKKGDKLLSTILIVLGVAALSFTIYQMIYGKAVVFGSVIFSELERGDPAVVRASTLGLVSIGLYLFSTLLTIVSSFCRLDKKAE